MWVVGRHFFWLDRGFLRPVLQSNSRRLTMKTALLHERQRFAMLNYRKGFILIFFITSMAVVSKLMARTVLCKNKN